MNNKLMTSVKFKRDYVAYSAVIFFFLIVISEVALALIIPLHLKLENVWAKEVSYNETMTMFDQLRNTLRENSSNKKDELIKGEASLLLNNLDLMAIFLRLKGSALPNSEVAALSQDLKAMSFYVYQHNANKSAAAKEKISSDKFIQNIIGKNLK